ncbi:MAG: VCBS repeat-containing protein [Planctomycetota bacterium]|nr:MAG: VCBS repeat-containing protein [Planctomycetota bacterium]REJ93782.1 MAG: VCBS repeat-containing protein [Planctomycetota bacterium]
MNGDSEHARDCRCRRRSRRPWNPRRTIVSRHGLAILLGVSLLSPLGCQRPADDPSTKAPSALAETRHSTAPIADTATRIAVIEGDQATQHEDHAGQSAESSPEAEAVRSPVSDQAENADDETSAVASVGDSPEAATAEPLPLIPLTGLKTWEEMDNPTSDGWYSEVLAEEAGQQLKRLAKLLAGDKPITTSQLELLLTEDVEAQALLPANLDVVRQGPTYRVERARPRSSDAMPSAEPHKGIAAFADALADFSNRFSTAGSRQAKFKIFRVTQLDAGFTTRQLLTVTGVGRDKRTEAHATWTIRWSKGTKYSKARIARVEVDRLEISETRDRSQPLLADCSEAVLGSTPAYQQQLRRGLTYWTERAQQTRFTYMLGTPGLAIGDVNGDGLDDVYLCQEEGLPNHLFLQRGDGTVEEASATWGVDWTNDSRSTLLIDLDNDGDQDLAVAVLGGVAIAMNDAKRRFEFRTVVATSPNTMSLSAADYDRDGDLDLYVCGYSKPSLGAPSTGGTPGAAANFVYHDANNGGRNALLRNDGHGNFEDVTAEVGLDENNFRFSLASAWEDYDADGDPDLYVANDYGRDSLYENRDGRFADVAEHARVEDSASGMAITWGDYDRDGVMDAYISNMYSTAGNRITFQQRFKQHSSDEVRNRLQRFARGNTLLRGRGDGTYEDVSRVAGVEMGRWAWSSNFVDLDNDGWEDLLVANGYVTDDDNGDL